MTIFCISIISGDLHFKLVEHLVEYLARLLHLLIVYVLHVGATLAVYVFDLLLRQFALFFFLVELLNSKRHLFHI